MNKTTATLAGLALSFLAFGAQAAEQALTPDVIIAQLRGRITTIGEGKAQPEDFQAATNIAITDMNAFIAKGENLDLLTVKDKWGKTPLNISAYYGFSEVVEILLAQPSVKVSVNEPDDSDITPWTYATFAVRQSAFACNPKLFISPFSWATLHKALPYYNIRNPYPKVRALLEQAGATPDMDKAKQKWTSICKFQSPETRDAIIAADDMQSVAITQGDKVLKVFMDKLQGR